MTTEERKRFKELEGIVLDLQRLPVSNHHYTIPVSDPGGQVIADGDAKQCLLCYRGTSSRTHRHEKWCVYARARAYRNSKAGSK